MHNLVVVISTFFVFLVQVKTYTVFPAEISDQFNSAATFRLGSLTYHQKPYAESKPRRTYSRPGNVAYKVNNHYAVQIPKKYVTTDKIKPRNQRIYSGNITPKKSPSVVLHKHNPAQQWGSPSSSSNSIPQTWSPITRGNGISQRWGLPAPSSNSGVQSWPPPVTSNTNRVPQSWASPTSNAIEESPEEYKEEGEPNHHVSTPDGSFPSFGGEAPRKGKIYQKPGEWAKPSPDSGIDLDFTPVQTYSQVRNTNTVKHVPQSEAFKDATSLDEVINAPRLKEVLRTKKIQEVYSEEGYEDTGYDHAGHERHAEHDEGFVKKDEGKYKIKDSARKGSDDSSNEESRDAPATRVNAEPEIQEGNASNIEPKITRSRTESSSTSVEYSMAPKRYKGSHKYSSKIRNRSKTEETKPQSFDFPITEKAIPALWAFPTVFQEISTDISHNNFKEELRALAKPTGKSFVNAKKNKTSSRYKAYPTLPKSSVIFEKSPNKTSNPQQSIKNLIFKGFNATSYFLKPVEKPYNKTSKYQRLHSKLPKRLRVEPFSNKIQNDRSATNVQEVVTTKDQGKVDERIVLPTIGYINSLTTAHFGKEKSQNETRPKTTLTNVLNLTQALHFLRSNKDDTKKSQDTQENLVPSLEPAEEVMVSNVQPFEPMKIKTPNPKVIKRSLKSKRNAPEKEEINQETKEDEEGEEDDENAEQNHDEKNEQIKEEERIRMEEERREKEKYEKELSEEISKKEKDIIRQTFNKLGIKDITDKFPDTPSSGPENYFIPTTEKPIDLKKYPFYHSSTLPKDSPLRYATHPGSLPRKSGFGMEFYESRDRILNCPDVKINLEDIPKTNSTKDQKTQPGENQRIVGLGDKISCLKVKYFDEDPLDSPFFRETEIDYFGKSKIRKPNEDNKNPLKDLKPAGSELQNKKNRRSGITTNSTQSNEGNVNISSNSDHSSKSNAPEVPLKNGTIRYHSSYQYHPNRTMQILVRGQNQDNLQEESRLKYGPKPWKNAALNETKLGESNQKTINTTQNKFKERVIPVKEQIDEPPANYFIRTTSTINGVHPPPTFKLRPSVPRLVAPVRSTKIVQNNNRITIPHNCMHMITKMAAYDGQKNLIIDCNDATLIQESRNGARHIKIIPKIPIAPIKMSPQKRHIKKPTTRWVARIKENYSDQSEWAPMLTYPTMTRHFVPVAHRFGRKSDENIATRNETNQNASSDHYIIDELKEDDTVRKGEVVEDRDHFLEMADDSNSTNPIEATTEKTESVEKIRKKRDVEKERRKIRKKSKLFPNKMLLDKIHKKPSVKTDAQGEHVDLGVNSPEEVIQDRFPIKTATTTSSTTSTTTTTTTSTEKPKEELLPLENKKFPSKRPLKRLSGQAFLVRYHKNKAKHDSAETKKTEEFWKINKDDKKQKNIEKSDENDANRNLKMERKMDLISPSANKRHDKEALKRFVDEEMKKHKNSRSGEAPKLRILHKTSDESSDKEKKVALILAKPGMPEYKIINRSLNSTEVTEAPKRVGRYMGNFEGGVHPTLYYVTEGKTGRGKWIANYNEEPERKGVTSDPSDGEKQSDSRKINYESEKVQKQKIRKNFFKRRSNKITTESNLEK